MKKIISIAVLALSAAQMFAQTPYEGLKFSQNDYLGSARTIAMGNAFTALGGDIGSLGINPAGSAVARYSQTSITMGASISTSDAMGTVLQGDSYPYCFDQNIKNAKGEFAMPGVGFVMDFKTGLKRGLKNVSFGFVCNATGTYLDNTYASGDHNGTSFAGRVAQVASGYPTSAYYGNSAYDNYDALAVLGWQSGMISNVNGTNDYVGATEQFTENPDGSREFFTAGALNQDWGRYVTGNKYDILINLGFNIGDIVFLGANLGMQSLSYSSDEYLKETPLDRNDFEIDYGEDGKTYFSGLKYQYYYDAKGSGIFGKFGIIITPGPVRIGLAVQTPTLTSVSEIWGSAAETNFDNSKFNASASTPEFNQRYNLHSPARYNAGLAYTIGRIGVISADYELTNFGSIKYKPAPRNEYSPFFDLNSDIKSSLGCAHAFRAGAEFKPISQLAIRAGYNLSTSGIKGIKTFDQAISGGLGYSSNGGFFCDAAVRCRLDKDEYIYPYDDYVTDSAGNLVPSPEILNFHNLWTAVVTVGFRF